MAWFVKNGLLAVNTSPEGQAMSELLEESFEIYNCFPVKAW